MTTKIITIQHKINLLVTVNIFLLIGKKVIIVDTGIRNSYKLVLKKLKELDIDTKNVSLILVTHSHPDHCLGITNMKNCFNAPVAVSDTEAPYLKKGSFSPVIPLNLLGRIVFSYLKKLHEEHDEYINPDIIFEKELDLKNYGVDGKVLLTPGHSVGGCSIILEDGNCIVGDLIIEDVLTKRPRINLFATDIEMLKKSLQSILEFNIKSIYTSHGNCWDIEKFKSGIKRL